MAIAKKTNDVLKPLKLTLGREERMLLRGPLHELWKVSPDHLGGIGMKMIFLCRCNRIIKAIAGGMGKDNSTLTLGYDDAQAVVSAIRIHLQRFPGLHHEVAGFHREILTLIEPVLFPLFDGENAPE